MIVRLLPWSADRGAEHMARDEALLASAVAGVASARLYRWLAPTLSLGYFQAHAPALAVPSLAGLDWLRRPTGGLALAHHYEITYALALPAAAAARRPGAAWLVAAHEAARDALADFGVASRLCDRPLARGGVLCFSHHTPGDVAVGDDKVVGSAQRKSRGALLQHGGILLRRSPHAPGLPGVVDLTGRDLSPDALGEAFVAALARRLSWPFVPGAWRAEEVVASEDAARSRYRSAAWNAKR